MGKTDLQTPEKIRHHAKLVEQLDWLTEDGTPLPQKALAYLLSYPEVGSVIPGARSIAQLKANLAVSGQRLANEDRAKLEAFWNNTTNVGNHLLPW